MFENYHSEARKTPENIEPAEAILSLVSEIAGHLVATNDSHPRSIRVEQVKDGFLRKITDLLTTDGLVLNVSASHSSQNNELFDCAIIVANPQIMGDGNITAQAMSVNFDAHRVEVRSTVLNDNNEQFSLNYEITDPSKIVFIADVIKDSRPIY